MGRNTYPVIEYFYKDKKVDYSALHYDKEYEGLEDYVMIIRRPELALELLAVILESRIKGGIDPIKRSFLKSIQSKQRD